MLGANATCPVHFNRLKNLQIMRIIKNNSYILTIMSSSAANPWYLLKYGINPQFELNLDDHADDIAGDPMNFCFASFGSGNTRGKIDLRYIYRCGINDIVAAYPRVADPVNSEILYRLFSMGVQLTKSNVFTWYIYKYGIAHLLRSGADLADSSVIARFERYSSLLCDLATVTAQSDFDTGYLFASGVNTLLARCPSLLDVDDAESIDYILTTAVRAARSGIDPGYLTGDGFAVLCAANPELLRPNGTDDLKRYGDLMLRFATYAVNNGFGVSYTFKWIIHPLVEMNPRFAYIEHIEALESYGTVLIRFGITLSHAGVNPFDIFVFGIHTLVKDNPALLSLSNREPFSMVFETAAHALKNNVSPLRLFLDILNPLLKGRPDLLGQDSVARLRGILGTIRAYLDIAIIPYESELLFGNSMTGVMKRYTEIQHGGPVDFSCKLDLNLYYLILRSSASEISYRKFTDEIARLDDRRPLSPPPCFERIAITENEVERVRKNERRIGDIMEYAKETAALGDEARAVEILAGLVGGLRQINAHERRAVIAHLRNADAGLMEKTADLIAAFSEKQRRNYQPENKRLIASLLTAHALMGDRQLLADITCGDAERSAMALKELYDDRLVHCLDAILPPAHYTAMRATIEADLGVAVNPSFDTMPLRSRIQTVLDELKVYNNIINTHKKLREIAHAAEHGTNAARGAIVDIKATFRKNDRPLRFIHGVYHQKNRVFLKMKNKDSAVSYVIEENNIQRELAVRNGRFELKKYGRLSFELVETLNDIVALDDARIAAIRRHAAYLKEHLLPVLTPLTRGMELRLRTLNKALQYTINTTGESSELLFLPAKDWGLLFKGYVGHDCSKEMHEHVLHPKSFFYKIIQDNAWRGYITLLELENAGGERALLFDVFNVDSNVKVHWPRVFERFVSYLAGVARAAGYRYILIPDNESHISNFDYIRRDIYERYRTCERCPSGFALNPPESKFQTSGDEYLVIWHAI